MALNSDVSNVLEPIQARNDVLRFLAQIECRITNLELPPLLYTLVFLNPCCLDEAVDAQLRCSFVNQKESPFLGIQAS